MLSQEYTMFIIAIIVIVWGAVAVAYWYENTQYKKSSYGRQSKKSFLQIINNQGARGEYRT